MTNRGSYLLSTSASTLAAGDYLVSPNGQYSAVMQDDGDFVLYWGRWPDRLLGAMWSANQATGKSAPRGTTATLQADGNFVVAGGFTTGVTARSGPVFAQIQDDGDFVMYPGTPSAPGTAYWKAGTATGTVWVHNSAPYVAHASVGDNDTGHIDEGKHGQVAFTVPSRTAAVELWMSPDSTPSYTLEIGALRAQRYRMTGSAFSVKYSPVSGYGSF